MHTFARYIADKLELENIHQTPFMYIYIHVYISKLMTTYLNSNESFKNSLRPSFIELLVFFEK
jgi:hypothetical protein